MATLHMVVDPLISIKKFVLAEIVPPSTRTKFVRNVFTRTQEPVTAQQEVATPVPATREPGTELVRVLERAATDDRFIARLTEEGSQALQGYNLSLEEQAALISGDIQWIQSHIKKLDERLSTWLWCRLQQEAW